MNKYVPDFFKIFGLLLAGFCAAFVAVDLLFFVIRYINTNFFPLVVFAFLSAVAAGIVVFSKYRKDKKDNKE